VTSKGARHSEVAKENVAFIDRGGRISAKAVLEELYELLEDYSPVWYTERHHNRATAVLQEISPQRATR
jgi:Holliday junction resolvasome RuvABC ATP-dependent DNA helicase subunit